MIIVSVLFSVVFDVLYKCVGSRTSVSLTMHPKVILSIVHSWKPSVGGGSDVNMGAQAWLFGKLAYRGIHVWIQLNAAQFSSSPT